jgi:RNA polymerase sigma-70 factor (ECF subfamily)
VKNWIEEIRHDANGALEEIYRNNRIYCTHWLTKNYSLSDLDAREVFQASVVILYENIISGKLKELTSSIRTYLIAICKNQSRSFKRMNSRMGSMEESPVLADFIYEDIDKEKERDLEYRIAIEAMTQLGEPCNGLLRLFYFEQKNLIEVATMLGYKNMNTAKTQKFKCMSRLRKLAISIKDKTAA